MVIIFSMEEYKKIKTVNRLSQTKQDILHLINEFGKYYTFKENVQVHFINDQLQKTETNTFSVKLFNFDENSPIIEDKILTKKNNRKTLKRNFVN